MTAPVYIYKFVEANVAIDHQGIQWDRDAVHNINHINTEPGFTL